MAMTFDGKIAGFIEDIEKEFLAVANAQDRQGLSTQLEVLDATIAEIERRLNSAGEMTGVPSKFVDLDRITVGFQRSDDRLDRDPSARHQLPTRTPHRRRERRRPCVLPHEHRGRTVLKAADAGNLR